MSPAATSPEWQASGLYMAAAALARLVAEAVQAWTAWRARRRLLQQDPADRGEDGGRWR